MFLDQLIKGKHVALNIPLFDVAKPDSLDGDQRLFAQDGYLVMKKVFPAQLIDDLATWTKQRFWSTDGTLLDGRLQDEWKNSDLV